MFTITKEFAFEAAHHLPLMPDDHQCKRPHGHSYRVIVELRSPDLDEYGFVEDYGTLTDIKGDIDAHFDHRDLVQVMAEHGLTTGNTTTAERLARWFYRRWRPNHPCLTAVTVCETAKTTATYRSESL